MKNEAEKIGKEEALLILQQEKEERAKDCSLKIQEALKNYNCTIIGIPVITQDGRISVEIKILPLD